MTVESDLVTLLSPLVSGRVFPDVAPTNTTRPYITYQQIGGVAVTFVERAVVPKKNGFIQITCWSSSRAASQALALQVEQAMIEATAFQAEHMSAPTSVHSDELDLYGTEQDFTVWSAR